MTLLDSFFDAMVRLDGDTLVMQVGQKPYLVRAAGTYRGPVEWGQVELSSKPLTLDAGLSMLEQILPPDQCQALSEIGAVEYEFAPKSAADERFTIVAARGGDDIWVEIRRRSGAQAPAAVEPDIEEREISLDALADPEPEPAEPPAAAPAPLPAVAAVAEPVKELPKEQPVAAPEPPKEDVLAEFGQDIDAAIAKQLKTTEVERPFVLVPIARSTPRPAPPPPAAIEPPPVVNRVEQLLRSALDANASSVFIVAGARPMMRVNGDVRPLGGDPPAAADIHQFVSRWRKGAASAAAVDERPWSADMPDIGRVECMAIDDYRGPGLTVHVVAPGLVTADHLGLSDDVQALCDMPDGLVLVASPRTGGKSTLVHAFVDLINRTRCDHIVVVESYIGYRHEPQHSFISQRETRGDGEAAGALLRAALREGPDVLVIDDLRGPEAVAITVDAARAGRLVFATIAAGSVAEAQERVLDAFLPVRRPQVRALLSGILRGAVAQTLVKSVAGPLVPARDIWLANPERRETLHESLVQLVREGRVNPSEALRAAPDREFLATALQEEGFEAGGERFA